MLVKEKTKKKFLGNNITYLLKLHKIDIKNLAIATGLPAATIARIRREGSNPTLASLEPLADFFRVPMSSLLYDDMSHTDYQIKKSAGNLVHIPVIAMKDINKWPIKSKITTFVGAAGISGKNVFGVRLTTAALAPAFQENSILVVDPDLKVKESDYVICTLNKDPNPVIRQLFSDGGNYFFKPINPGFGEMQLCNKFKILGVIIKSIENFR